MKRIGVLANGRKPDARAVLERVARKAKALGMELVVCEQTGDLLSGANRVSLEQFAASIDVLMALGGDGTVLRAVRALGGADKPVLGVNLGSLGFLTSVTEESVERALDVLASGKYTTSTRTLLQSRVLRGGKDVGTYRALNDVVVGWGASSRVSTIELVIDDEPVSSYVCDGLIVSTPTGSTGHSLSSGGPILHPGSPCFVVSVICPHTLSNRPVVVSDGCRISVRIVRTMKKLLLSVDGQEEQEVGQGDQIELSRNAQGVRFVHLPGYSYYSVLRQKLGWRGSSIQ